MPAPHERRERRLSHTCKTREWSRVNGRTKLPAADVSVHQFLFLVVLTRSNQSAAEEVTLSNKMTCTAHAFISKCCRGYEFCLRDMKNEFQQDYLLCLEKCLCLSCILCSAFVEKLVRMHQILKLSQKDACQTCWECMRGTSTPDRGPHIMFWSTISHIWWRNCVATIRIFKREATIMFYIEKLNRVLFLQEGTWCLRMRTRTVWQETLSKKLRTIAMVIHAKCFWLTGLNYEKWEEHF